MGFLDKLKSGLAKTRKSLVERVETVLLNRKIDETVLDEIEEILISSDVGAEAAGQIIVMLKDKVRAGIIKDVANVKTALQEEMSTMLGNPQPLEISAKPHVILMIGVNGVGKTTTIGKLSSRFRSEGRSVLLAAGDTFRAAAVEQLEIWAQRTGAIHHQAPERVRPCRGRLRCGGSRQEQGQRRRNNRHCRQTSHKKPTHG